MDWTALLTFASDAELAIAWGAAFLAIALVALLGERRRLRRNSIDRVGFMPWLGVFLGSAVIGGTLLVMGVVGQIRG